MPTMLHLGLGSFHRAHQAVYLQRLIDLGDHHWTLAGGNIRPDMADTMAALQAQQGAYTLETISPDGEHHYERIRSIHRIVEWTPCLSALVALGAHADTRIVSFTVTEAGYYLDSEHRLDVAHFPDLQRDIEAARHGRAGSTLYGALTAILRERMRQGSGPVTLLN